MKHRLFGTKTVATLATGFLLASAASAAADNFTLRIASGHPAKALTAVNAASKYFVPKVTARVKAETKHTVKFIEGYAGTLTNMFETLESTQKGLVDIGLWCTCFEPAKASILNFNYFIPWVTEDPALQQKLTRQMYKEFPVMRETLEKKYGQKFLGIAAFDAFGLGTKFKWDDPSQLKGRKIGGGGPNLPWVKFAGATPVQTKLPEAYNSLQTGVYEGLLIFPATWWALKLYEVAPHWTETGWGAIAAYIMTVNTKSFNKLPADVQKIITEEAVAWEKENAKQAVRKHAFGLKKLKDAGSTVTKLSDAAKAKMAQGLKDWPNSKAKELDKAGLSGTALFKRYIALAKENGVKFPVEYQIK